MPQSCMSAGRCRLNDLYEQRLQESLRCYSVVPVVMRELVRDDVLCGHQIPRGSHVVQSLKAVHQQWTDPEVWRPERFLPGGEYDQFDEDIRQYMVSHASLVQMTAFGHCGPILSASYVSKLQRVCSCSDRALLCCPGVPNLNRVVVTCAKIQYIGCNAVKIVG